MPKLLFLVTEDWYFVSHRLPLARAARAAGYEVTVVTRLSRHGALLEAAGLRVIPFAMARRGMGPLRLAREVFGLQRLYRREKPDIVHHVALKPIVVGGIAARLAGVKASVSAFAGMGFLFAAEGRLPLARALLERWLPWLVGRGAAIVQNAEDAALLRRLGIPPQRLHWVAGAGVDVEQFSPQALPQGEAVVMLPARLLWDKGVGEFVAAARSLRRQRSDARFVLVGDPDPDNPASVSEADLAQWVREGVVEWWGRSDDMAATLGRAHVVCLPSYREGLPKVLLEAMACGRACVTTDTPGCRDAVRHGDNGLLVPPRDAQALAGAIARLLDDPLERTRMGARGRERAVAEFSQERVIEATLRIYRELMPCG